MPEEEAKPEDKSAAESEDKTPAKKKWQLKPQVESDRNKYSYHPLFWLLIYLF